MGSPFLHFALGCSHLPENSILFVNRPFSARFSNCCNSLNFEAKINFNTTRQNDLKWTKTCTGLKFDLEQLNGPQTKFICDSLYKHPVDGTQVTKSFRNYSQTLHNNMLPPLESLQVTLGFTNINIKCQFRLPFKHLRNQKNFSLGYCKNYIEQYIKHSVSYQCILSFDIHSINDKCQLCEVYHII